MSGNDQVRPAQIGEQWNVVVLGDDGVVQRLTAIQGKDGAEMDAKVRAISGVTPVNGSYAVARLTVFEMPKPCDLMGDEPAAAGAFANLGSVATR